MAKQFPEGIRVFQPFPDSPNWVIGNILITKSQLVDWISKQPGENVRLDILKAKNGNWYTSVSEGKQSANTATSVSSNNSVTKTNGDGSIPWGGGPVIVVPSPVSETASDDLPF